MNRPSLGIGVVWCLCALGATIAQPQTDQNETDRTGGVESEQADRRAVLRLTGEIGEIRGEVRSATVESLVFVSDRGETEYGWDRVVRLTGPGAAEASAHLELADTAWRARRRLERGDFVLAEAGFEELFEVYAGRTGPTAEAVAEGVLRCRLRRGAHASALAPWLSLLEAGGDGRTVFDGAAPVIDPATGLCPALPPVWTDSAGVRQLAERGITRPGGDEPEEGRARLLGEWYRFAAGASIGRTMDRPEIGDDPTVRLVADLVLAQHGTGEERSESRGRLRQSLGLEGRGGSRQNTPAWLEAWKYAAIGRSLVREADEQERLLGVVTMLHLPARFGDEQAYLAGLCLAEAAEAMDELGRAESAGLLRDELRRRYPGHPASGDAGARGVTMNSPVGRGGQEL